MQIQWYYDDGEDETTEMAAYPYDVNKQLEDALQQKLPYVNINMAGEDYDVDLKHMQQIGIDGVKLAVKRVPLGEIIWRRHDRMCSPCYICECRYMYLQNV